MSTLQMEFESSNQCPDVNEFIQLRNTTGWPALSRDLVVASLERTLFHALLRKDGKLVAMGRIIGDGAAYYYVQDVVVHPEYQGQGLGQRIMEALETYLNNSAAPGATIALLSAQGKEGFYQRYGFVSRTGSPLGLGMSKTV